jgi:hypothetical protein
MKSKKKTFIAEPGEEDSLTIYRTSPLIQIGFISSNGKFFLETEENEQVLLEPEDLLELKEFIDLLLSTF